jgi:hypothetical protein
VVILGLGPSLGTYLDAVKRMGGRKALADEVWAINALGDVVQCDRVFHMDDLAIQEQRAAAVPGSNIATMVAWLKQHKGPIYTSIRRKGYRGLVEFPLEEVTNHLGHDYFNSTAAYAVAYAVHIGVRQISIFGFDFTYPNAHHAEKGRACVEFWLGIASARGIKIALPENTSLMDQCEPDDLKYYGYDAVHVTIAVDDEGQARFSFSPRESLPTAAEMEVRYDHSKHPSPLVRS